MMVLVGQRCPAAAAPVTKRVLDWMLINFLSATVINEWNALNDEIVQSKSLARF